MSTRGMRLLTYKATSSVRVDCPKVGRFDASERSKVNCVRLRHLEMELVRFALLGKGKVAQYETGRADYPDGIF